MVTSRELSASAKVYQAQTCTGEVAGREGGVDSMGGY